MKKVLIGGWNDEELEILNNFLEKSDIDEIITLTESHSEYVMKDIIQGKVNIDNENLLSERVIIFDGFNNKEISEFIEKFKRLGLTSPVFAMITKHSIKWKLKDLLKHLIEEREEFKKRMKKN